MSPRLPPELLELIIDDLSGYHKTLGACALTSSTLLPYARANLFNRIYLSEREEYGRFLQLLQESSHLKRYIHRLRLRYIQSYPNVAPTILRLVKASLVSLSLLDLQWPPADMGIQKAILGILDSPSLQSLHIDCRMYECRNIEPLLQCPKLRHAELKFSASSVVKGVIGRRPVSQVRPKMDSLVLESNSVDSIDMSDTLHYMDLSSLSSLAYSIKRGSLPTLSQLLIGCGRFLTTLIWEITSLIVQSNEVDLPFADIPNLEHLCIFLPAAVDVQQCVMSLDSLLSSRSSNSALKPLEIFTVCPTAMFHRWGNFSRQNELKDLLESLKRVTTTRLIYDHRCSEEIGPVLEQLSGKYEGTTCVVIGPIDIWEMWSFSPRYPSYES